MRSMFDTPRTGCGPSVVVLTCGDSGTGGVEAVWAETDSIGASGNSGLWVA